MNKKIVITGASGFIGNNLFRSLKERKFIVLGLDINNIKTPNIDICDISSRNDVHKKLNNFKPDIIIHCAAMKNLIDCEENKDKSFKYNVLSTEYIVEYAKENKCKVIYISSDVVFDGKEGNYDTTSTVHPINWYGKTKCFSELIIKQLENFAICRTALVIGRLDKSYKKILRKEMNTKTPLNQTILPQFIYEKLISGNKIMLSDQIISNPTPIELLSELIFQIVNKNYKGVFNTAGVDSISRFKLAIMIAEKFHIDKKLILKDKNKIFPLRPKNISLRTNKTLKILGVNPEQWRLNNYLSNIKLYE